MLYATGVPARLLFHVLIAVDLIYQKNSIKESNEIWCLFSPVFTSIMQEKCFVFFFFGRFHSQLILSSITHNKLSLIFLSDFKRV